MSENDELTDVVAERRLEAVGPDGAGTVVTLAIGRPDRDPLPGGDWRCRYRVTGLGDDSVRAAFGVDPLQALLLAVYKIQVELSERARTTGARLAWLGQADLGLHVDPGSASR